MRQPGSKRHANMFERVANLGWQSVVVETIVG